MAKGFTGRIELDVRGSIGDWDAFLPDAAPEGAPNVLVADDADVDLEVHPAAAMARD